MQSPLILRSTHDAFLKGKDEQIAMLKEQLAAANHNGARAMGMYQKSVDKLTEALTPKPAPALVRRRPIEVTEEKPKTLNLRDVDPNDNAAIMALAIHEMPAGRKSGTLLTAKMRTIREQILELVAQGPDRQMGTIPVNVTEMIAQAEATGVAQAKVG